MEGDSNTALLLLRQRTGARAADAAVDVDPNGGHARFQAADGAGHGNARRGFLHDDRAGDVRGQGAGV